MSGGKLKLKQIQKHLKAEEWELAVGLGKEVLKEEKGVGPNVYNALVFAGVALRKLDKDEEAEKVLTQATKLSPELPLAYQGLLKIHTDREEWDKLCAVLQGLVNRAVDRQDIAEMEKHLQRIIQIRQEHGPESELLTTLQLLLPSSQIYPPLLTLPQPGPSSSPQSGYTPFPLPPFSSPQLSPSALSTPYPPSDPSTLPTPLPSIPYLIHNPDISLALLLHLTTSLERTQRLSEEKEVTIRRSRLNAGPERMVRKQVGLEVLGRSSLPGLYEEILAHPAAPDEVRRGAESRLLRFWYRLMLCLSRSAPPAAAVEDQLSQETDIFTPQPPPVVPSKDEVRVKIQRIVKGMVLLEVVDEGGWALELEWADVDSLDKYDLSFLHKYITLFPTSSMTSLLFGYLRYHSLPLPNTSPAGGASGTAKTKRLSRKERMQLRVERWKIDHPGEAVEEGAEEEKEGEGEEGLFEKAVMKEEVGDEGRREPFSVLMSGLEANPKSLLANRILAEVYLKEEDYANAIATAEKGKEVVKVMQVETGLKLTASSTALDVVLGTALVHFYPPKHHPRALKLLDSVLTSTPTSIPALLGRGYVLQSRSHFPLARVEFERAAALALPGSEVELEAREEAGWCCVEEGELGEGRERLEGVVKGWEGRGREKEAGRGWWRIGEATWRMGEDHREEAHTYFVTALRHYPTYASAFTSLGIYYLSLAPPDSSRAQRCFQKAFELDATQGEAARRLAVGLAEDREWALVDVIAKRVIAGEGGLEGGLAGGKQEGGDTTKFLVKNAWAWKAVGGVEMSYRKYASAASAFQVALRADSNDAALWMRLGEAYAKAGRHVAALKALQTSHDLEPDNWLCLYYMGDVRYQLGLFAEALVSFREILELSPGQHGVIVRVGESHLALGRMQKAGGFRARALQSFCAALEDIGKILEVKDYRLVGWKMFGDIVVEMFDCLREEEDILTALDAITPNLQRLDEVDEEHRSSVPRVASTSELLASEPTAITVLKSAICAYAYRADLLKFDTKVPEPPLHDLAAALHLLVNQLPINAESSEATEACIKAAVLAVKKALDSDPGSSSLWNDFGTVAVRASAQLAQHAFIVALELEPRNPVVWANLGFLALQAEDLEVANQSFLKAQISDPEYALSWLGQALVASKNGNDKEAQALFEQAATLSTGSLLSSNLGFSNLLFQPYLASSQPSTTDLHQPTFALARYTSQYPSSSGALLLEALLCERLGQYETAEQQLEKAVAVLETEYEADESPEVEERYSIALVNLGRIRLARSKPQEAVATFDDCLGLLGTGTSDRAKQMKVQCRLGSALGYSALEDVDSALVAFQESLDACDSLEVRKQQAFKEEISILLSRALWAVGGDDAREAAKGHLLECFDQPDHSASAMATLAAIGVLTDDDGLIDVVAEEIKGLSAEQVVEKDGSGLMAEAMALVQLDKGHVDKAIQTLSNSVHREPYYTQARADLARGLLESNRELEATAVLSSHDDLTDRTAGQGDELKRTTALSMHSVSAAQVAVRMAPWRMENWQALSLLS